MEKGKPWNSRNGRNRNRMNSRIWNSKNCVTAGIVGTVDMVKTEERYEQRSSKRGGRVETLEHGNGRNGKNRGTVGIVEE